MNHPKYEPSHSKVSQILNKSVDNVSALPYYVVKSYSFYE